MALTKNPRSLTEAAVAAAITLESADLVARIMRRLEDRGMFRESREAPRADIPIFGAAPSIVRKRKASAPAEIRAERRESSAPFAPLIVEKETRKHGVRTWRRVAFTKTVTTRGKVLRLSEWETNCVACGAPFLVVSPRSVVAARGSTFEVTRCEMHRIKSGWRR